MLHKTKNVGYVLYAIAVALITCWAIGFFGYNFGGILHVLLIIAFLVLLFLLVKKRDELRINRMVKSVEESIPEQEQELFY